MKLLLIIKGYSFRDKLETLASEIFVKLVLSDIIHITQPIFGKKCSNFYGDCRG